MKKSRRMTGESPISSIQSCETSKKSATWKTLDVAQELKDEGLIQFEVLEPLDSVDKEPVTKNERPKKRRKVEKVAVEEPVSQPDITDEQLRAATKDWQSIIKEGLNIPYSILRGMYEQSILSPTRIQRLSFKSIYVEGKDVVGCAETGSGKTLAYAIPIILSLQKSRNEEKIESVVLLPTRELAIQVKNHLFLLMKNTNMRVVPIIGGISAEKQIRLLKKNPAIVVATPGRLWERIQDSMYEKFDLRFLVLDEADKFVQEKAFKEVTRLVDELRKSKTQKLIFSATILNTRRHLSTLFRILKTTNPTIVVASNKGDFVKPYSEFVQDKNFRLDDKGPEEVFNSTIPDTLEFKLLKTFDKDREVKLAAFLLDHFTSAEKGKVVIFVNTISYAYRLEPILSLILWRDKHELRIAKSRCVTLDKQSKVDYVASLHSKLKQKQRLKRLEQFNKHNKAILICTDVASRGLDLPNIDVVFHFQPPRSASDFLHRSGRTARLGAKGFAICMCGCSDFDKWKTMLQGIDRNIHSLETILECIPEAKYEHYKKLLTLACNIEQQEYRHLRKTKEEAWLTKAAKEADMLLNDDEDADYESKIPNTKFYKVLKKGKQQLIAMRNQF